MTELHRFRVRPLEDFQWPLTFRFHVQAPYGRSQQVLTVDAPPVHDNVDASCALGHELWKRGLALASTASTTLLWWETVVWRQLPIGIPKVAGGTFGLLSGPSSGRADTAQLQLLSGHDDDMGFRRVPMIGSPLSWLAGRRLTNDGCRALEWVGQVMVLGLVGPLAAGSCVWLVAYPQLLTPTAGNPSGVAFRTVEGVRACRLTDRAPEPSSEPWP